MPAHRIDIPEETLEALYLDRKISPKDIAAHLGCGETTIRKRLKEYGIPMRSRSEAIRLAKGTEIDREMLVRLYHNKGLSQREAAECLGCSEDTVRSRMQKYDIPRRTSSEIAQLTRGVDLPKKLAREWYEEREFSMAAIAERLGCSQTAVYRKLVEYGIERRKPWEHMAVDLREDELRRLYEDEELTVEAIAEMYDCSPATVSRKMKKHGIEARPPWRVSYSRFDFSADPLEKAYLVGFRLGDLYVRRAELSIEVITTTTCQDQVELMHELFDQYGHVYENQRPDGAIFLEVRLNDTFEFLLSQEDRIPDWVLSDDECFFAFMAGYVDADGSIRVVGPRSARLDIQTYDAGILEGIARFLIDRGYALSEPTIIVPAGYTNPEGIPRNKDTWGLNVHRCDEVARVLTHLLPHIKHAKRRQDARDALCTVGIG